MCYRGVRFLVSRRDIAKMYSVYCWHMELKSKQPTELGTGPYTNYTAGSGHLTILGILVVEGHANVDAKDSCGQTPRSLAVWGRCECAVRILVRKGADFNLNDGSGRTPL
jgi:hypothetical protein